MHSVSFAHRGAPRLVIALTSLAALLMMASSAGARPLSAALSNAFTYQGNLTDGGVAANGVYDFTFGLYDDAGAGNAVGSLLTKEDVTVTTGVFTVQLDFGDVFDGTALWLEIAVRPGGSIGAYTTLTPRQALTGTPYALYSAQAPWNGLTGVPAGFADGVDDLGGGASYQNLVVVAKSGGDFTTITGALNSITTAADNNRFLIYVAPGVYSEQVTMKQFVDIQGSGERTTKITFTGSATQGTGVVTGVSNAELRSLTVENTGGNAYATAVSMANAFGALRLTQITAIASGGTTANTAVYMDQSVPTLTNVTASATASEGSVAYGVYNNHGIATLKDVVATAAGGTSSYGLYNLQGQEEIINSILRATGATDNYGMFNSSGASWIIRVRYSQISGSTSAIYNEFGYYTSVSLSELGGGAPLNYGGLYCAGVVDGYGFHASTCS